MASKIEDYGLIGNLRTSALVARNGDIDWLCAPRFDSAACLASLIGYDEHGRWATRPTVTLRETRQRYREDSLVLETELVCEGGVARLVDFMSIDDNRCDLVRIVEGVSGEVPLEMLCGPRFGYGVERPLLQPETDGIRFTAGPDSLFLRAAVPLTVDGGHRASSHFTIKQGQRVPLLLTYYPSHEAVPGPIDVEAALARTDQFWKEWAGRCAYQGPWRDAVVRSLITLKAMIYAPTGGIVAAPTTSLPEEVGGVRNWDYRYCWLRDASLTLDALMIGGYIEEARGFRDWLLRATAGDPANLQIMYDLHGGRRLTEFELPELPGYEGSRPVHVGNAASGQFQLDVYGEVLSCLYAGAKMGLGGSPQGWPTLVSLLRFLESAWQRPDDGIWEVRGGRRHFTHSKVMAWVAFDRSIKAIEQLGMGGDEGKAMVPHLSALRDRVHREICERGFNTRIGAFTQSYGSDPMDASILIIPHVGFLPPTDPRVKGTVAAVERTLLRDGFVLRYSTEHGTDGLPGSEGAFLACSFWLADNYAFAGRLPEAKALFERLLALRNHLGLLAEEYEPRLQRQIGNFPQAFSHLALIFTAHIIDLVSKRGQAGIDLSEGAGSPRH